MLTPWRSPIYWSPRIYRATLRLLYGSRFHERFEVVASLVDDGDAVVDLCCGCAYLYEGPLRGRVASYTGVDLLPTFVRHVQRLGQRGLLRDLQRDPVPEGDTVVMLGSLYHFFPNEAQVLSKMVAAARKQVILLEPIENLAASGWPGVGRLARLATYIGKTSSDRRLDAQRLDALFAPHRVLRRERVVGGKYVLAVLEGGAQ